MNIGQSDAVTIGEYNAWLPSQISYPGGVQRSQDYDGFARLKTIDVINHADNPILNYAYQYDNAHNIIQHQTTQQRQADSQHPKSYEYDEADRLITVTQNNTQTMSWQYDDNSNRTQQNKDNRQQQYHYNANQELIEISSDEQTTYYQYDPNGALIEQSGSNPRTYQYNSYGRLAAVIENEQTIASYGYNVFGQRTSKTINDLTTYYHYSEQGLESEYNEQGELMQGYYYSPQNSLGNAPVAIKHNDNGITQASYYQNDHLNTPQMLTRPNGAVVWQGQYDAFGEVTQTNTQVSNPLRFPGQYQDDETGLYYNWNRYYDNSIGRYVTSDPIGLNGGLNTYGYALGNPLRWTDSRGLEVVAQDSISRNALNTLQSSSSTGESIVSSLNSSGANVNIRARSGVLGSVASALGGGKSYYNPDTNTIIYDPNQGQDEFGMPNEIVLGHELVHAYHDEVLGRNSRNTLKSTLQQWTVHGIPGGANSEMQCFPNFSENAIRDDYGIKRRR